MWYWHCSCIVLVQFSSDCRKTKLRWLLWPITSGAEIPMSQIHNMKHTLSKKYWEDMCEHFTLILVLLLLMILRVWCLDCWGKKTLPSLYRNAKPKRFQNNSQKAVKSSQLPVKIITHLVAFNAAMQLYLIDLALL